MDDLNAVQDITVPGGWIIRAENMREQIRWAQQQGHANCYYQRFFSYHEATDEELCVICVIDLFDERWPTKSVTNDAEYVVRMAVKTQGDYPIVYRDTEGNWDELRHHKGHFACFRCLATENQDEAMKRVLALHEQDEQSYGTN